MEAEERPKFPSAKTVHAKVDKACNRVADGDYRTATFVITENIPGVLDKEVVF